MKTYDLIVIGTGPAGEKAAVKAAYFGYKVAVIEKATVYGGAGVNTGTLPSKTLKETALYLSGKYDKGLHRVDRVLQGDTNVENFMFRKNWVIETESDAVRDNLQKHNVDIFHGTAAFLEANTIEVNGADKTKLKGKFIIIATGSYPHHPTTIPFDNDLVHDSDTILNIKRFPKSIAVLGAGVIGCEYATIFSTLGTKVYLINRTDRILPFIDQDVISHLLEHMLRDNIELLLGEAIEQIEVPAEDDGKLKIQLKSEKEFGVDMFLFAAGRNGNIAGLGLDKVGIETTERETIVVNKNYQTHVPNIYAVGDVIGFPALASTGMDQGRVAVAHMFQSKDIEQIAQIVPYGIYTVPEISTAGISEENAKSKGLAYSTGIAYQENLPRGKIMGAKGGLLKLVFTSDDLVIRGVHIIGHLATELIHHGVELIEEKKTLLDVIGRVYNFPTLHDLYKYAAYDGLGKRGEIEIGSRPQF